MGPDLPGVRLLTTTQRMAATLRAGTLVFDTNLNSYFTFNGSTAGGVPATGYATNSNRPPGSINGTLDAFGDSIMFGADSADPSQYPIYGYIYQAARINGWAINNHAVSGSKLPDQAPVVYGVTPTAGKNYVICLGTNDIFFWGSLTGNDPNKVDNYRGGMSALLAYLAIPQTNKLLANDSRMTLTGTWASSSTAFSPYWGFGMVSTTNGSTMTATVYGTSVYLAITIANGNTGTFTVTIDNGVQINPLTGFTGFNCVGTSTIFSNTGPTYQPYLIRFAGLENLAHTVTVTVTSATNAANQVFVDWVSGNSGVAGTTNTQFNTGPVVYANNIIMMAGFNYTAAGGTQHINSVFNLALKDAAKDLAGDGLNIGFVNLLAAINPTVFDAGTNPLGDLAPDGIHPFLAGHNKMRDQVLAYTNANAYPSANFPERAISSLAPVLNVNLSQKVVGINTTILPNAEMEIWAFGNPTSPAPRIKLNCPNTTGFGEGLQFQCGGASRLSIGYFGVIISAANGPGHMIWSTRSSGTGEFMRFDAVTLGLGLGTTTPTKDFSLGGNQARTIWSERHTVANTAGNSLTIQAGGATLAATDKAGGTLVLLGGISTGAGASAIQFKVFQPSASGTADNAAIMAFQATANTTGPMFGALGATPVNRPSVTGSKASGAAWASLLTGMVSLGWVTDNTTT